MTFKRTLTISVILHICLFTAALLFSAGLFKGSGNSDEKVFFVKLAVESNRNISAKSAPEVKKAVPKKTPMVKQQVVIEQPPVPVTPNVTIEKAHEPSTKERVEDYETAQEDPVNQKSVTVNDLVSSGESDVIQAALAGPMSESNGLHNGSVRSGISPAIIDFIGNAIERVKIYPVLARKRGIEGTVYVSFRINESGTPDEIEIEKSSGHSILDSATVRVVKKAAPYPYVKSRIEVPVAYRLKK